MVAFLKHKNPTIDRRTKYMNMEEYEKIKDCNYFEYCNYLHKKYGIPQGSYFLTPSCKSKNKKISRGNEGLYLHHITEYKEALLCVKGASLMPFEWQEGKNLVYCNLLEHLLLHTMIAEETFISNRLKTGFDGATFFIIPELNDVYSGFKSKIEWLITAHNLIKNEEKVYLQIIKRFQICHFFRSIYNEYTMNEYVQNKNLSKIKNAFFDNLGQIMQKYLEFDLFKIYLGGVYSSFNAHYKLWDENKNDYIYKKIQNIKIESFEIENAYKKALSFCKNT